MGFELTIASKCEPPSVAYGDVPPVFGHTWYTAITLNGDLEDEAARAIMQAISDLRVHDADSVLVEMEDVRAGDVGVLERFATQLMALRGAGSHVQVSVREPGLYEQMQNLTDARDWLLDFCESDQRGARVAIHLDGPGRKATP